MWYAAAAHALDLTGMARLWPEESALVAQPTRVTSATRGVVARVGTARRSACGTRCGPLGTGTEHQASVPSAPGERAVRVDRTARIPQVNGDPDSPECSIRVVGSTRPTYARGIVHLKRHGVADHGDGAGLLRRRYRPVISSAAGTSNGRYWLKAGVLIGNGTALGVRRASRS